MTHPRAAKGRFFRAHHARSAAAPRRLPDPSRRAAGQLAAAAAIRLRQPLNGRPTSILIAAVDDLVMRMSVFDADDPAAAKRARWAQNSARIAELKARGLPWVVNNVETTRITDQLNLPPCQPRSSYLWPPRK